MDKTHGFTVDLCPFTRECYLLLLLCLVLKNICYVARETTIIGCVRCFSLLSNFDYHRLSYEIRMLKQRPVVLVFRLYIYLFVKNECRV